uniref:TnsA-like heteromeric transposase endonuclease subunit n=1 Tax=Gordonia sp. B7-2 TaxID=3420932 RepID=UPI003D8F6BD9
MTIADTDSLWHYVPDSELFARVESGGDLDGEALADNTRIEVKTHKGDTITAPLLDVDTSLIDGAPPIHKAVKYKGRKNYSGNAYVVTGNRSVPYESLLEMSRIMIADFDPAVTAINPQAFRLLRRDGDRVLARYPDLFLLRDGLPPLVVDITPESKIHKPDRIASFTWTAAVVRTEGWDYQMWCGADPMALGNLTLLMSARRPDVVDQRIVDELKSSARCGEMHEVESSITDRHPLIFVRPALLHLIWTNHFRFDMSEHLQGSTMLHRTGGLCDH